MMKRLWISCFVLVLTLTLSACKTEVFVSRKSFNQDSQAMEVKESEEMNLDSFESKFGELQNINFDIKFEMTRLRDSLYSAGVDTILQYFQAPDNNLSFTLYRRNKEKKGSSNFVPSSWNVPSFTFWKNNNEWRLRKIDKSIQSEGRIVNTQLIQTFFNFVSRNGTDIQSGVTELVYTDNEKIQSYEFHFSESTGFYPFIDKFTLDITISKERFILSESLDQYTLHSTAKSTLSEKRVANSEDWFSVIEETKAFQAINLLNRVINSENLISRQKTN